MAAQLLDRLKRSLFKGGPGAGPDREPEPSFGKEEWWEAELEEEEESVTERLGGTLRFDDGEFGDEDGGGEAPDSDSDYFLGESMEEGLSSTGGAPFNLRTGVRVFNPSSCPDGWSRIRRFRFVSYRC